MAATASAAEAKAEADSDQTNGDTVDDDKGYDSYEEYDVDSFEKDEEMEVQSAVDKLGSILQAEEAAAASPSLSPLGMRMSVEAVDLVLDRFKQGAETALVKSAAIMRIQQYAAKLATQAFEEEAAAMGSAADAQQPRTMMAALKDLPGARVLGIQTWC